MCGHLSNGYKYRPLCNGHFFGRTFYTLTMFKLLYNEHLSIIAALSSVPEVAVLIVETFNCTLCMTKKTVSS